MAKTKTKATNASVDACVVVVAVHQVLFSAFLFLSIVP